MIEELQTDGYKPRAVRGAQLLYVSACAAPTIRIVSQGPDAREGVVPMLPVPGSQDMGLWREGCAICSSRLVKAWRGGGKRAT